MVGFRVRVQCSGRGTAVRDAARDGAEKPCGPGTQGAGARVSSGGDAGTWHANCCRECFRWECTDCRTGGERGLGDCWARDNLCGYSSSRTGSGCLSVCFRNASLCKAWETPATASTFGEGHRARFGCGESEGARAAFGSSWPHERFPRVPLDARSVPSTLCRLRCGLSDASSEKFHCFVKERVGQWDSHPSFSRRGEDPARLLGVWPRDGESGNRVSQTSATSRRGLEFGRRGISWIC